MKSETIRLPPCPAQATSLFRVAELSSYKSYKEDYYNDRYYLENQVLPEKYDMAKNHYTRDDLLVYNPGVSSELREMPSAGYRSITTALCRHMCGSGTSKTHGRLTVNIYSNVITRCFFTILTLAA